MESEIEIVTTSDLKEGDIVLNHRRMRISNRRVVIDRGEEVVAFDGEFLDDAPNDWPCWAHDLGVQGNYRATWCREVSADIKAREVAT